jgi:hypothetical protein
MRNLNKIKGVHNYEKEKLSEAHHERGTAAAPDPNLGRKPQYPVR